MEVKNQKYKLKLKNPQIRFLYDLKGVLYDKAWLKNAKNFELYYIYQGVKEKNNLRYDITIIPPRMLGKEFVKTKGHYHFGNFGELYKVLAGEGIFLIQKRDEKEVYYVKAKKGEYILIPPNFGHTIINPSSSSSSSSSLSKTMKMANWVSKKCQSDYKSIEKKKGFCYYYTICGWLKNRNYKRVPKLKEKNPQKVMPKNLNFLYGN